MQCRSLAKTDQIHSFYRVNYTDKSFLFSHLLFLPLINGQWKYWLCWENTLALEKKNSLANPPTWKIHSEAELWRGFIMDALTNGKHESVPDG